MNIKPVLTASLGNTLEWFDFGLFIMMAPIIGEKFFPASTPTMSLFQALAVFAAGFICRPLGGILFGHLGDTQGRAITLRISILLITLSTLIVGLLPTYESIGLLSPILFTVLRLLQGISIGGEYSGVMIYLAESAPAKNRGFITSFAATGANIGFLLATLTYLLTTHYLSIDSFHQWGWRLPFIIIGIPASFVLYNRFKLRETHVYTQLEKTHHLAAKPFMTAFKHAPKSLLKIFGLTCMSSTLYYAFFGLMPLYLKQYVGIAASTAMIIQSALLAAMLFLVPLAGWCGDRFSRRTVLILTCIGGVVLSLPCFYLLHAQSFALLLVALSIATILSSLDQGNTLTAVVENCPAAVRYSGIAFSYNLGIAIFGGTAPLMMTVLTEKIHLLAPAVYLSIMALISLMAATTLLAKNKMLD